MTEEDTRKRFLSVEALAKRSPACELDREDTFLAYAEWLLSEIERIGAELDAAAMRIVALEADNARLRESLTKALGEGHE